uniref:Uncharacterized protein n=1 Tax=Chromera velia CCMP2878 TaxID=1169474 RepID=A0A0G4HY79_9ALVE|eukprot:Cvel_9427.t1-p1 / transcript=Cvel_9427.t1 / gene=Cvel_9427 / organism=Chromera_velia_CCMP2878 / gene_product=hypothetical protein / transcript_product=hypothetical protein / location=Cvel_scaffold543:27186-42100(-) / protein_length=3178 / sequence_SO=supercontig / SO=protein_coding / is_pseudo=false
MPELRLLIVVLQPAIIYVIRHSPVTLTSLQTPVASGEATRGGPQPSSPSSPGLCRVTVQDLFVISPEWGSRFHSCHLAAPPPMPSHFNLGKMGGGGGETPGTSVAASNNRLSIPVNRTQNAASSTFMYFVFQPGVLLRFALGDFALDLDSKGTSASRRAGGSSVSSEGGTVKSLWGAVPYIVDSVFVNEWRLGMPQLPFGAMSSLCVPMKALVMGGVDPDSLEVCLWVQPLPAPVLSFDSGLRSLPKVERHAARRPEMGKGGKGKGAGGASGWQQEEGDSAVAAFGVAPDCSLFAVGLRDGTLVLFRGEWDSSVEGPRDFGHLAIRPLLFCTPEYVGKLICKARTVSSHWRARPLEVSAEDGLDAEETRALARGTSALRYAHCPDANSLVLVVGPHPDAVTLDRKGAVRDKLLRLVSSSASFNMATALCKQLSGEEGLDCSTLLLPLRLEWDRATESSPGSRRPTASPSCAHLVICAHPLLFAGHVFVCAGTQRDAKNLGSRDLREGLFVMTVRVSEKEKSEDDTGSPSLGGMEETNSPQSVGGGRTPSGPEGEKALGELQEAPMVYSFRTCSLRLLNFQQRVRWLSKRGKGREALRSVNEALASLRNSKKGKGEGGGFRGTDSSTDPRSPWLSEEDLLSLRQQALQSVWTSRGALFCCGFANSFVSRQDFETFFEIEDPEFSANEALRFDPFRAASSSSASASVGFLEGEGQGEGEGLHPGGSPEGVMRRPPVLLSSALKPPRSETEGVGMQSDTSMITDEEPEGGRSLKGLRFGGASVEGGKEGVHGASSASSLTLPLRSARLRTANNSASRSAEVGKEKTRGQSGSPLRIRNRPSMGGREKTKREGEQEGGGGRVEPKEVDSLFSRLTGLVCCRKRVGTGLAGFFRKIRGLPSPSLQPVGSETLSLPKGTRGDLVLLLEAVVLHASGLVKRSLQSSLGERESTTLSGLQKKLETVQCKIETLKDLAPSVEGEGRGLTAQAEAVTGRRGDKVDGRRLGGAEKAGGQQPLSIGLEWQTLQSSSPEDAAAAAAARGDGPMLRALFRRESAALLPKWGVILSCVPLLVDPWDFTDIFQLLLPSGGIPLEGEGEEVDGVLLFFVGRAMEISKQEGNITGTETRKLFRRTVSLASRLMQSASATLPSSEVPSPSKGSKSKTEGKKEKKTGKKEGGKGKGKGGDEEKSLETIEGLDLEAVSFRPGLLILHTFAFWAECFFQLRHGMKTGGDDTPTPFPGIPGSLLDWVSLSNADRTELLLASVLTASEGRREGKEFENAFQRLFCEPAVLYGRLNEDPETPPEVLRRVSNINLSPLPSFPLDAEVWESFSVSSGVPPEAHLCMGLESRAYMRQARLVTSILKLSSPTRPVDERVIRSYARTVRLAIQTAYLFPQPDLLVVPPTRDLVSSSSKLSAPHEEKESSFAGSFKSCGRCPVPSSALLSSLNEVFGCLPGKELERPLGLRVESREEDRRVWQELQTRLDVLDRHLAATEQLLRMGKALPLLTFPDMERCQRDSAFAERLVLSLLGFMGAAQRSASYWRDRTEELEGLRANLFSALPAPRLFHLLLRHLMSTTDHFSVCGELVERWREWEELHDPGARRDSEGFSVEFEVLKARLLLEAARERTSGSKSLVSEGSMQAQRCLRLLGSPLGDLDLSTGGIGWRRLQRWAAEEPELFSVAREVAFEKGLLQACSVLKPLLIVERQQKNPVAFALSHVQDLQKQFRSLHHFAFSSGDGGAAAASASSSSQPGVGGGTTETGGEAVAGEASGFAAVLDKMSGGSGSPEVPAVVPESENSKEALNPRETAVPFPYSRPSLLRALLGGAFDASDPSLSTEGGLDRRAEVFRAVLTSNPASVVLREGFRQLTRSLSLPDAFIEAEMKQAVKSRQELESGDGDGKRLALVSQGASVLWRRVQILRGLTFLAFDKSDLAMRTVQSLFSVSEEEQSDAIDSAIAGDGALPPSWFSMIVPSSWTISPLALAQRDPNVFPLLSSLLANRKVGQGLTVNERGLLEAVALAACPDKSVSSALNSLSVPPIQLDLGGSVGEEGGDETEEKTKSWLLHLLEGGEGADASADGLFFDASADGKGSSLPSESLPFPSSGFWSWPLEEEVVEEEAEEDGVPSVSIRERLSSWERETSGHTEGRSRNREGGGDESPGREGGGKVGGRGQTVTPLLSLFAERSKGGQRRREQRGGSAADAMRSLVGDGVVPNAQTHKQTKRPRVGLIPSDALSIEEKERQGTGDPDSFPQELVRLLCSWRGSFPNVYKENSGGAAGGQLCLSVEGLVEVLSVDAEFVLSFLLEKNVGGDFRGERIHIPRDCESKLRFHTDTLLRCVITPFMSSPLASTEAKARLLKVAGTHLSRMCLSLSEVEREEDEYYCEDLKRRCSRVAARCRSSADFLGEVAFLEGTSGVPLDPVRFLSDSEYQNLRVHKLMRAAPALVERISGLLDWFNTAGQASPSPPPKGPSKPSQHPSKERTGAAASPIKGAAPSPPAGGLKGGGKEKQTEGDGWGDFGDLELSDMDEEDGQEAGDGWGLGLDGDGSESDSGGAIIGETGGEKKKSKEQIEEEPTTHHPLPNGVATGADPPSTPSSSSPREQEPQPQKAGTVNGGSLPIRSGGTAASSAFWEMWTRTLSLLRPFWPSLFDDSRQVASRKRTDPADVLIHNEDGSKDAEILFYFFALLCASTTLVSPTDADRGERSHSSDPSHWIEEACTALSPPPCSPTANEKRNFLGTAAESLEYLSGRRDPHPAGPPSLMTLVAAEKCGVGRPRLAGEETGEDARDVLSRVLLLWEEWALKRERASVKEKEKENEGGGTGGKVGGEKEKPRPWCPPYLLESTISDSVSLGENESDTAPGEKGALRSLLEESGSSSLSPSLEACWSLLILCSAAGSEEEGLRRRVSAGQKRLSLQGEVKLLQLAGGGGGEAWKKEGSESLFPSSSSSSASPPFNFPCMLALLSEHATLSGGACEALVASVEGSSSVGAALTCRSWKETDMWRDAEEAQAGVSQIVGPLQLLAGALPSVLSWGPRDREGRRKRETLLLLLFNALKKTDGRNEREGDRQRQHSRQQRCFSTFLRSSLQSCYEEVFVRSLSDSVFLGTFSEGFPEARTLAACVLPEIPAAAEIRTVSGSLSLIRETLRDGQRREIKAPRLAGALNLLDAAIQSAMEKNRESDSQ